MKEKEGFKGWSNANHLGSNAPAAGENPSIDTPPYKNIVLEWGPHIKGLSDHYLRDHSRIPAQYSLSLNSSAMLSQ